MNDPSARHSRCRLSSSDPLVPPGVEELPAAPLPLSKGRGAATGVLGATAGVLGAKAGALGATPSVWGSRHIGDPDPAVGVPATGLANCQAALVEGRQRGQDRRPQPWIVAERRDALGGLGTQG
jgi:hypothetical protein